MAAPTNSGVYEIVNLKNGKRYIGSAKNFRIRWNAHRARLRKGQHHSRHLQAAWLKHGEEAFAFRVLLQCAPEALIAEEQAAMDRALPDYNVNPIAASSLGRRFTEETKAKIGAKAKGRKCRERTPEHRAAISASMRGRQLSADHMAALQAGRRAAKPSPEANARRSESLKAAYAEGRKSRARPPEYREKIAAGLRGRKATPEHRANQVAAQLGTKRGPYNLDPAKAEARRAAGKRLAAVVNKKRWGWEG